MAGHPDNHSASRTCGKFKVGDVDVEFEQKVASIPGRSEQLRGLGRHLPEGPHGMRRKFHQLCPPILWIWSGLDPAGLLQPRKPRKNRRRRAEAGAVDDVRDVDLPLVSGALPDEVQNGLARQINLVKPRATLYPTRRQPDPKDQIVIDASTLWHGHPSSWFWNSMRMITVLSFKRSMAVSLTSGIIEPSRLMKPKLVSRRNLKLLTHLICQQGFELVCIDTEFCRHQR